MNSPHDPHHAPPMQPQHAPHPTSLPPMHHAPHMMPASAPSPHHPLPSALPLPPSHLNGPLPYVMPQQQHAHQHPHAPPPHNSPHAHPHPHALPHAMQYQSPHAQLPAHPPPPPQPGMHPQPRATRPDEAPTAHTPHSGPPTPSPLHPPPEAPAPDMPTLGLLYGPPEGGLPTSYVGSYTLYSTIGEGAFGKVKIAVDRRSNIRVAIKIMDKSQIRAQDFTSQVRREIYIMRCLKHRHIVRMIEVLTSDTKLYIVMEFVRGGELFEWIGKGRTSEDVARHYFQQLVDGVHFCHKKGVAHRDLKPENLLVDENGDIKITDFGFSSMKGMDVNTGLLYTLCGTPDYCAPEIVDNGGKGYTGAKVDAWSCGIVLYALLCGRLPFQEPDTEKLYDLILACNVKYPPNISPGARDLLVNVLVRDPNKRFDLQRVKRHPWFLENYEGDDAKLLKKRPFFNKNPGSVHGSTPSSPTIPQARESSSSARASQSGQSTHTTLYASSMAPSPQSETSATSALSAPNAPNADNSPETAAVIAPMYAAAMSEPRQSHIPPSPSPPADQQPSPSHSQDLYSAQPHRPSLSHAPSPQLSHPHPYPHQHPHSQQYSQQYLQQYSQQQHSQQQHSQQQHSQQQHPQQQHPQQHPQQQPSLPALAPMVDAGTPRNIHSGVSAPRMREGPYGSFRPVSPAADLHARAPTPPTHEVITKVEDRPATPARRQHSASTAAAFKAAVAAANIHPNEPNVGITAHSPNVTPTYVSAMSNSRLSPTPLSSPPSQPTMPSPSSQLVMPPCQPLMPNGVPNSLDSNGFSSGVVDMSNRMDDSSSEPDSLEEYENKPAPLLEMPADPRQVLRLTKDGRRPMQSLSGSRQPRQRSDLTGMSLAAPGPSPSAGSEPPSASTSAIQRPRRAYGRDGPNSGSVIDSLALRMSRPENGPSSPTVVYSPSPVNGSGYGGYRSVSPGFNTMRPSSMPPEDTETGGYGPQSGSSNMPWQSSSSFGYSSSRDEPVPSSGWQTKVLSQHLWNMTNKLRGTSEAVNPNLSKELKKDMNVFVNELRQITKVGDVLTIFINFLTLFDKQGLTQMTGSSPGFGPSQSTDEDFETGTNDGREEAAVVTGDLRSVGLRAAGTDISSEEEPLSLSPVVAETGGPQLSDLERRRNLSDLLTKWMKSTDRRTDAGPEGEGVLDLVELQRLVREQHSGRDESNLADDLLRLMNDEGNTAPFGNVTNHSGQSPPPPHVQTTRSADSYTQQTRYLSNLSNGGTGMGRQLSTGGSAVRSVSNNNTALPQEYVPGRFKEPNSMPSRGRNGNDRQTGLSGRTDVRPSIDEYVEVGVNGREREATGSHMANSMGMHDVPYYMSDKKGGMANKLRGVLQTMKTKNHRLGEHHAQFRSSLPADEIMRLLGRVLQDMGGKVTIKKETKRKMKCQLTLTSSCVLYAGIELIGMEDGLTCVAFRRSRADKGKTDTESFHTFFERVRSSFIDEANAMYPTLRMTTANAASRRRRNNGGSTRDDASESHE